MMKHGSLMKHILATLILLAGAAGLQAQNNPLSAELKRFYEGTKNNITRSAEKMPDADYSFKPIDTVRPFGGEDIQSGFGSGAQNSV